MSDYMTRFAVIVKDIYHREQHHQNPRESYYVATVITNCQGGRMTTEGREYTFGRTNGEVEFWELNDEEQANAVADKFNRLYQKGIYANIRQLA